MVDLAGQGETIEEALASLKGALELYFEPPVATAAGPQVHTIEVDIPAMAERGCLLEEGS